MASFSSLRTDIFSREQRRQHYGSQILGLNAYDRHKKFMSDYVQAYPRAHNQGASNKPLTTDLETLRENYRFIRTGDDDLNGTWEERLAKRYYDKLFKEYCIADMSRYKESKVGLRWRSEKEVIDGKGQFTCGNKTCTGREGLHSYEVNFAYKEFGENKQALVKLRVCSSCAHKLNYRKEKELKRQILTEERKRKRRRESRSHRRSKKSLDSDVGSDEENGRSSSSGNSETSDENEHKNVVDEKLRKETVDEKQHVKTVGEKQYVERTGEKQKVETVSKKQHVERTGEKQRVESANKKQHVKTTGEKQHVQPGIPQESRDCSAGTVGTKAKKQPSQGGTENEEFDEFFEDMFL